MDSDLDREIREAFAREVELAPDLAPPSFPHAPDPPIPWSRADAWWGLGAVAAVVFAFNLVLTGPPPEAAKLMERPAVEQGVTLLVDRVFGGITVLQQAYLADGRGDEEDTK